jgi:hypothetical protein
VDAEFEAIACAHVRKERIEALNEKQVWVVVDRVTVTVTP